MAGNLSFTVDANDRASSTFATIAAELKELGRQLRELDGRNVRVKVKLDAPSSGQLALLDRAKTALAEIDGRTARAKVEITGVPDAAQVRQMRAASKALRELDDRNVNARINITGDLPDPKALRAAARALKDLQDVHEIAIHISITGAVEALAQVAALRQELRGIPRETTTTVNVDVDKGALARVASVGTALLKIGTAGGLAAAGLGTAVPAVATLAGSLTSLVGLAPIAVGGLASLVAVTATVKVGLSGVGDALKETDPKKFAESLKELSPAAAGFVKQVRSLQPALDGLKLDVQNRLFAGMAVQVRDLAVAYLPTLRSGMGGVATELNGLGKDFVGFATQANTVRDTGTIFENTRSAVEAARPGVINLAAAFRDVAVVGTAELPALAAGWTNATGRFREFISQARESGQLKVWIQSGVDTLQKLGSIAGNVGSSLYSVFTAAKASGADFLTTLDNVTERLAKLLASSTGQSSLTAFFRESRAAIDALLPGVEALAVGALKMIGAFSATGGLAAFGAAASDVAVAVAPLLPMLGTLAGGVLNSLAAGASAVTGALGSIVGVVNGVVGALGPVAPMALAAVVAFKALALVGGPLAALGTSIAATAAKWGLYATALTGSMAAGGAANTAVTRLGGAVTAMGKALPIVGVAVIALATIWQNAITSLDEGTKAMERGGQAAADMTAKVDDQLTGFGNWLNGMLHFSATSADMRAELEKQRAGMTDVQRAQSLATQAQGDWDKAVQDFGPTSSQASAAAAAYARANENLTVAQKAAADAAMTHEQRVQQLADTMNGQINSALAYATAVERTASAQKEANDALSGSGAKSDEYKSAVLSLAQAMSSQADSARKQAEALGGTEAGVSAYNTEILRAADVSTQAGRDAFGQLAAGLDSTGLAAISSAAKMSGLRTEIVTLPDGRTVTVVVAADRAKLDSVKQGVDEIAGKEFIGTVKLVGDPLAVNGMIQQVVQFANGQQASITLNGNGAPVAAQVGQSKYLIDSTTGVMTLQGNPGPGEANLTGLKVKVDSTTGVMTLDGNPGPVDAKTAAAVTKANTSIGIITIDGNPTLANGKTTSGVAFANGSRGTITIDGNQTPVNGKVNASVTYANGKTGIIQVDANTAAARAAIDYAARNRTMTITALTNHISQGGKTLAGGGVIGYAGGGIHGPVQHAARGMVLPGYAPGRDTEVTVLSKGEAVLVPELVRALGARRILAANAEASGGRPATVTGQVAGLMDGTVRRYAGGGIRAEDGSTVRAGFYSAVSPQLRAKQDGRGIGAGEIAAASWSSLMSKGWRSVGGRLYYPGTGPAAPATPTRAVRTATTATAAVRGTGSSLDLSPLVAELRSQLGQLRTVVAAGGGQQHDARLAAAVRESGLSIEAAVARLGQSSPAASARGAFVAAESGAW